MTHARDDGRRRGGVLIIVQNLPVPFDRRVWLECQSLVAEGYPVSVVCPGEAGDPAYELRDGVAIYKYRPYAPGGGTLDYLTEYLYSFLATARLVLRARRQHRFRVIQACNPPDIFWPIGLVAKLFGIRYVFDHHDLCPELFQSRFPDGAKSAYRMLLLMERATCRVADHVISTNGSYRQIAIERSGKTPSDVTVVRTGPDLSRLARVAPDATLCRGRHHLVAYLGVMGPQDGVENVVLAADVLVHAQGRTDIAFTLMGRGDSFDELVALRDRLGLQGYVEFLGRVPDETVASVLSTASVGLSPDPLNPLNDVSTMNKTMEYMAFGVPVVAFDLRETRVSAADAAMYAAPGNIEDFAAAIATLCDDDDLRRRMSASGRTRVESQLSWQHQQAGYLDVYRHLIPAQRQESPQVSLTGAT